ncbi:hypothetical protein OG535_06645 [Kitasatospora sp. NBC_00085]|uniref:hypothetical protein n=1 Tax=unclassified Kitasatospora TaxID=2633591 RepID=UPI003249E605
MHPTLRTALSAALLGAAVPAGVTPAAATTAAPREANQGYSIPVGGVTDLGSLGLDFARLLGT